MTRGEELSGEGPHLDDDDWAGRGSHWWPKITWPRPSTPDSPEGIQKQWRNTFRLDCSVLQEPVLVTETSSSWRGYLRPMKQNNGETQTCTLSLAVFCTLHTQLLICSHSIHSISDRHTHYTVTSLRSPTVLRFRFNHTDRTVYIHTYLCYCFLCYHGW